MQKTDVCILGAGPGGATAALFLASKGIRSVLIDKAKFPRDKICGDALSGKVVSILNKLNPELVNQLSSSSIQVGSYGVKFFAPNLKNIRIPFKKDYPSIGNAPGFISKRIDFDNFLIEKVKQQPLIQLIENTQLKYFKKINNEWLVGLNENEILFSTKLLIVADGAHSSFAREFGKIEVEHEHYCAGIRAYYKNVSGMDEDNFIELHFLDELLPGYFWIFPLPNGQANVGIGMRSDIVSKRKANLKKLLPQILEKYPTLKERFKNAELIDDVKGYGLPLGSKKRTISGDNYLLVGDAASLIDPFTGEGIGNAMLSGMVAAAVAEKAIASNDFSKTQLKEYDEIVYRKLWNELSLSKRLQNLSKHGWLFNFVVNKASRNKTVQETISCMFNDLDIRSQLRKPSFYFKLLFG
ncbi:geranylgeranyl hydrogenase BchP [Bacteroidota bacterium]|nr:geranylgeranyl hydrogenase BchP [Bacteroidota bacterium]